MKTCFNHPDQEVLSKCHGCGKEYCASCLDEGIEYYYCKNSECQALLKKELPEYAVPESVICPNCNIELDLSEDERMVGKFHCPECDAVIDYTVSPPKIIEDTNYTEILSSLNQGDIALIKSILEDEDIDYVIYGENFLGIRPLLEPARILVNTDQVEVAKNILKDFDLNIYGVSTNQDD